MDLPRSSKIRKTLLSLLSVTVTNADSRVLASDGSSFSTIMPAPIRLRPSKARGYANHGWLKSFHTFSFANYFDPEFEQFGPLCVINEDTVAPGEGFGEHPHRDAEIFSYILSGTLKHHDSMNNKELLNRGDIQFTSAGSGIRHSEFNGRKDAEVRFLQIWALPRARGLTPNYQTKTFPDEKKIDNLLTLLTPDGANGTIQINQDFRMHASLLSSGSSVKLDLGIRRGYVHVPIMPDSTGLEISGKLIKTDGDSPTVVLMPGDGAFIEGVKELHIKGRSNLDGKRTEVVIFDFV